MGRLDVRVVEARNLPNPQSVGMVDPYVKVTLDHNAHKTSVIENKQNPQWNEVFKFTVADHESAQLEIEVWNSNVTSDDFLGCYNVSLSGLVMGEVKDEWYLLKQCKANAEIHLRLLAVDFGARPPAEQSGVAPLAPVEQAPIQPVPVQQPPMQQPPPVQQPPPAGPPGGGYGAPTYGGGPQQPSGVYNAPAPAPVQPATGVYNPPPQQQPQPGGYGAPAYGGGAPAGGAAAQPQWGPPSAPVSGQVVTHNNSHKKSSGGGLFGALGSIGAVASKAVDGVGKGIDKGHRALSEALGSKPAPGTTGHQGTNQKQALWVNTADGFVFVVIDGSLRHVPDPNVFAALFPGAMNDHAGMNTFSTAPGSPAVPHPFGRPLPPFAHIRSCNGEFYFIDDQNGQQCRRHLNQGAFHNYSFLAGQNMQPVSLQELQEIPQGPPM